MRMLTENGGMKVKCGRLVDAFNMDRKREKDNDQKGGGDKIN